MFNNDGGYSLSDIAAATGGSRGGFGFGDSNGWWIILLFLFALGGNWGNRGGYGGGGSDASTIIYPMANQTEVINNGFNNAAIQSALNGISTSLCSGFAGVTAATTASQNALAQQMYSNQLADLERSFAAQTAATANSQALQAQLAQCCCENRLATANLNATIAQENCADREALNYATRDILNNQNSGIQRILDQMCADKIDAKNEKIADLERQLTLANLAASQGAQTAAILADNAAQTTMLEQYLAPVARPAYLVQNPNAAYNYGCGCNTGCDCNLIG